MPSTPRSAGPAPARSEPPLDRITFADRRVVGAWAVACADRVLPIFEATAPGDIRPRAALDAFRAFARGELRFGEVRARAVAAHAAAREVGDPAAAAAARAAGSAAAVALIHDDPGTLGALKHVLAPAAYAALALERLTGDGLRASAELRWAIEHASQQVLAVVRRLPPEPIAGGRLAALIHELDVGLRA